MKSIIQAEIVGYYQSGELPNWLKISEHHHSLPEIEENDQIKDSIKI